MLAIRRPNQSVTDQTSQRFAKSIISIEMTAEYNLMTD